MEAIPRRQVHFEEPETSENDSEPSLAGATACAKSSKGHPPTPYSGPTCFSNGIFSPASEGADGTPGSSGGWKIGSSPASGKAAPAPSPEAAAFYSPASASLLASVKKVDDLRSRLEQLEATLKEMESRAVEQLDAQLQVGAGCWHGAGLRGGRQQPTTAKPLLNRSSALYCRSCRRRCWPRR